MDFPIFSMDPNNMPPEMREQIALAMQAEDLQTAHSEDKFNRAFQFLMDMDPEQLGTFQWLLASIAGTDEPLSLVHRLLGQIDTIMRLHYPGLCNHCGRAQCGRSAPTVDPEESERIKEKFRSQPLIQVPHTLGIQDAGRSLDDLMEEFGVIESVDSPTGFKCSRCNMTITGLADRMRREPGPGGCPGCRDKAMHG